MQLFKYIILTLFLSITLSGCAKITTIRTTANYSDSLSKSSNMLILPPMVEVNTIDAGGKPQRMHDYEDHMEHIITEVIVEKLREKGYSIKSLNRRTIHDFKISKHVLAFQEEYQRNIDQLYNPLLWNEEKALAIEVSLKTDLKEIRDSTNGDIAVFAEYFAKHKTSGALAKDVALALFLGSSGSANIEDSDEFLSLRVAMIDITNNKILWSNIAREGYGCMSSIMSSKSKIDRQRVNQLSNSLFAKLPKKNQ